MSVESVSGSSSAAVASWAVSEESEETIAISPDYCPVKEFADCPLVKQRFHLSSGFVIRQSPDAAWTPLTWLWPFERVDWQFDFCIGQEHGCECCDVVSNPVLSPAQLQQIAPKSFDLLDKSRFFTLHSYMYWFFRLATKIQPDVPLSNFN